MDFVGFFRGPSKDQPRGTRHGSAFFRRPHRVLFSHVASFLVRLPLRAHEGRSLDVLKHGLRLNSRLFFRGTVHLRQLRPPRAPVARPLHPFPCFFEPPRRSWFRWIHDVSMAPTLGSPWTRQSRPRRRWLSRPRVYLSLSSLRPFLPAFRTLTTSRGFTTIAEATAAAPPAAARL